MFMPKKNRIAIYSFLYKEGVMTCQKDTRLPSHHILPVPNVHVRDAMKSLKSRDFVREVFNWQWHYYFLTEKGVEYLREYLHLPENVVPATHKKPAKAAETSISADRPAGRGRFGKEGGAPGEFRPRFGGEYRGREGGFGRGGGSAAAAAPAPTPATA